MPLFAECCVIIPCSTIEDFPSQLDPAGARSLLGGLTAVWHPRLIAATRRTPTWHRSDDLPPAVSVSIDSTVSLETSESGSRETSESGETTDSDETAALGDVGSAAESESQAAGNDTPVRLLVVPEVCVTTLPSELREAVEADAISHHMPLDGESREVRIRVSGRGDALEKIASAVAMIAESTGADAAATSLANASGTVESSVWTDLTPSETTICEHDFFALGYTWWQTQVLTRRLRYTSNLDHLHFENRLVDAATAFVDGRTKEATEALHDCYDALAEERDHYFSSDPALIDLTLLTPGTIDRWLDGRGPSTPESSTTDCSEQRTKLATPQNILVDESVADAIASGPAERRERFADCLKRDTQAASDAPSGEQGVTCCDSVGWFGGGPASDFSFDEHSIASAEQRIADAVRAVRDVGPIPLNVYGRLGGGIAGEWVPAIAAAGFDGIVPIDFLNGRGFDDESKVLLGEGDHEVEALTAKPIDADDESSFLTLSTRLGEAIDRGEIATALMVHWPGGGCDSFHDVRRAASWSLCLGRLWRMDDYFTDGERPYHHGSSPKATPSVSETLADAERRRERLQEDLRSQSAKNLLGFASLVDPATTLESLGNNDESSGVLPQVASSLGFQVDATAIDVGRSASNALLIHPSYPAARTAVYVAGKVSPNAASVFDASTSGTGTDLIVDVPAWGFSVVGPAVKRQSTDGEGKSTSSLQKITRWLTGGSRRIVTENRLSNEFMEVSIHREHGGIEGVYSGAGRGNRFSTRLLLAPVAKIAADSAAETAASQWATKCDQLRTLHDSRGSAVIDLSGTFERSADSVKNEANTGGANAPKRWQVQYRLERGSRRLLYRVRFSPDADANGARTIADAWKLNPVLRVATAEATPIVRAILREKLVRTSARAFQSSLGYVIDEDERTTLVASESATIHRRSGDRFFDSLLSLASAENAPESHASQIWGESADSTPGNEPWSQWQSFAFGFDVRHPVASAKSFAMGDPVPSVPVLAKNGSLGTAPTRGWLIHPSPATLDVQVVDVGRVGAEQTAANDKNASTGKKGQPREFMALHLRVIQTASRGAAASLRLCRDVHSVHEVSSLSRPFRADSGIGELTMDRLNEISNPESIGHEGDRVRWSQPSHGVVHMVVLFAIGEQA